MNSQNANATKERNRLSNQVTLIILSPHIVRINNA